MPFEQIWNIVSCLHHESEVRHKEEHLDVDTFSAVCFKELLEQMPSGVSSNFAFKGEMGMEFVPPAERPLWQARIRGAEPVPCLESSPSYDLLMSNRFGFSMSSGGEGHTTVDYGEVLSIGLEGIWNKANEENGQHRAIRMTLEAMRDFAASFRCEVPWKPASNLHEALQSIWFIHLGIALSERAGYSLSLGRMDRYLVPFVENLPDDEVIQELKAFFRLLDNAEFMDGAMAVNVGGRPDGFTRMSRLIIRAMAESQTAAPLLAARISPDTSESDFEMLCDRRLWLKGQPTFYGENSCHAALKFRGVPQEELSDWAVNSCMGIMLPGREWQDMWGAVFIMPVFLELAVNGGRAFSGPLPDGSPNVPPCVLDSYEALEKNVLDWFAAFAEMYIRRNEEERRKRSLIFRNPFVSAIMHDCIERRRDVLDGGIRFKTMIIELFGTANLSDALFAIRELVFKQHKYSLKILTEAVRNNFKGLEHIRQELLKLPKYGQNNSQADALMATLSDKLADIVIRLSPDGVKCAPSLHTLDNNVDKGKKIWAGFDGRLAGAPLAKNAGTSPHVSKAPTSLLLSASSIPQHKYFGGQPVDLWMNGTYWFTQEGRRAFRSLLETYFSRGGLQVQVNAQDKTAMMDAMAHPELHYDLIVRIGGFSRHFVELSREVQREFIERAE